VSRVEGIGQVLHAGGDVINMVYEDLVASSIDHDPHQLF